MKYPSMYLEWYVNTPKVQYDLRSSGINFFEYSFSLKEIDLSVNYAHGNPQTVKVLAQRYHVASENIFTSSEGASGQNMRIIKYIAERSSARKNEAIVEYPTYEPLLRLVQNYFPQVKRLQRNQANSFRLNADELWKIASNKTALLVLTNPHTPSGHVSSQTELKEIMEVAHEFGFYVLCDEIYAEFERSLVPTLFSIDPELGIVTTSFSKAYGLGGLRLGIALAEKKLVDELYLDALSTTGPSSNIIEIIATKLLTEGANKLEQHKKKWIKLKNITEKWLKEKNLEYFPNNVGITYWVKLPLQDTYKWIENIAIPKYSLAPVPGAFFLFRENYQLIKSNMIRIGLGYINPEKPNLEKALEIFEKALKT